jgi:hypothetical protein
MVVLPLDGCDKSNIREELGFSVSGQFTINVQVGCIESSKALIDTAGAVGI